jgi:hypothetical protein
MSRAVTTAALETINSARGHSEIKDFIRMDLGQHTEIRDGYRDSEDWSEFILLHNEPRMS